jgi:hypothetical protein
MGVPSSPLPSLGGDNATEDPKIRTALQELQSILTGSVDDSNLASPSGEVWRPVFGAGPSWVPGGQSAGSYFLRNGQFIIAVGASALMDVGIWIPPSASDVDVAGKEARIRLASSAVVNATAPGTTLTVGLRPITAVAGGTSLMTFTVGAALLTCTYTTPAAGSRTRVDSAAVALASLTAGAYAIGVVTAGALAANSVIAFTAQLEMQHA